MSFSISSHVYDFSLVLSGKTYPGHTNSRRTRSSSRSLTPSDSNSNRGIGRRSSRNSSSDSVAASSSYLNSVYVSRNDAITTSDRSTADSIGGSGGTHRDTRSSKSGASTESGDGAGSSESGSSGSALRGGTTVTTLLQDQGVKIICSAFDQYTITVSKYTQSNDNLVAKSPTLKLLCMYVRREIRGLTIVDLSRTMEALRTVYRLSATVGQGLYGPSFMSIAQLLQLFNDDAESFSTGVDTSPDTSTGTTSVHNNDVTPTATSHRQGLESTQRQGLGLLSTLNEGTGFLSQRMRLTNLLEASLQSIDRSLSMPYWDYTIEGKTVTIAYYVTVVFFVTVACC